MFDKLLDFLNRVWYGHKKWFSYRSVICDDCDGEPLDFIILVRFKLQKMLKHFEMSEVGGVEDIRSQIKQAIDLADHILNDDFCKVEWDVHYGKWGEPKLVAKKSTELETKEFRYLFELTEYKTQKAYEDLFNIIGKNLQYWWD